MFIKTRAQAGQNDIGTTTATKVVISPIKKKRRMVKNTGRWEKHERMAFLRGYREFGKGKWKQICSLIPSRTTIQVKTHAQVVLKRMEMGEDVFEELDLYLQEARDDDIMPFGSSGSESRDDVMGDELVKDSSASTTNDGQSWKTESEDFDAAMALTIMRCGVMSAGIRDNDALMHDAEPSPFRADQPLHFAMV